MSLVLALILSMPVTAQEQPAKKKPAAKKQVAAKKPAPKPGARPQATPEQIRKFNELQKKQQKAQP